MIVRTKSAAALLVLLDSTLSAADTAQANAGTYEVAVNPESLPVESITPFTWRPSPSRPPFRHST